MFEKLAVHCCNYTDRMCLGAFFKLKPPRHWLDKDFADKQCKAILGEYCWWLTKKVIPSIPTKNQTAKEARQMERWEQLIAENKKKVENEKTLL